MRALLVEAQPSVRSQLHAALHQRGWRVTVADTGAEGVQRFRSFPFPLVVVGRTLPDGDGLEVVRSVRATTAGRAAYLVVTLPAAVPEATRPLVEAGADDFLTTPLLPAHLAMRLAYAECRLAMYPSDPAVGMEVSSYPARVAELEHALRVQQAAHEELFSSAPEGLVVVDEHDRVVRINGEFTRMFGYTEEDALGRAINELIVPDHLRDEGRLVTRGVVGGRRLLLETERQHRDGRLIDVSLLATPIRVGDGSIGAYGIYRDITERKVQERALRESEARYRALFDQSPLGIFLCDTELQITHCNERLTEITGLPPESIVGTRLRDRADCELLHGLSGAAADQPTAIQGPYNGPGGDRRQSLALRYAPLREASGQLLGGMGLVEDVTDRERADQELRAQAAELERVNAALRERTLELEAAMKARNRLYTAMNHELRTPISAIMLHQELLLSGALGPLPDAHAEALQHSQTATQHLLGLVREILDLAKIEAGKMTLHHAEVAPASLLGDLIATVRPLARRYGSEIYVEMEPGPERILTDPQRVRQVLLNLVSNAAKFGRGRPIRIRCHRTESEELTWEVRDEGVGIHPSDLAQIFEDFVQVGPAQEGGTGLGLAISRRLAELLHGRLEVESEPDVGSTFRLIIPTHPPDASAVGGGESMVVE